MKTSFLISAVVLLLCAPLLSGAQNFSIKWSSDSDLKYDFDDALRLKDGKTIILKSKLEKSKRFGGGLWRSVGFILLDKNMAELATSEPAFDEKEPKSLGLKLWGDKTYFIYQAYNPNDKTTAVYACLLNEKTLAIAAKTTLGTYSSDGWDDQAATDFKLSFDSSKILMFVEGPDRKKDNKKFFISVFDNSMKMVWKKDIELPYGDHNISIYDKDLNNDGSVYVAIKNYEKEVSRMTMDDDGNKMPAYEYSLLAYHPGVANAKEIKFNLQDKFIQGTKLINNDAGELTVAGLYKSKSNGNINGAFYTTINKNTSIVTSASMTAFPAEIISLVDKDNFASDKDTDPGLYNKFRIMDVLKRSNGSIDLVCEYRKYQESVTTSPNGKGTITMHMFTYGDIIDINIQKDQKINFTRVPKNQKNFYGAGPIGFYPIVQGDKLILLYNNLEDAIDNDLDKKPQVINNYGNSVFMAAIIDANGKLNRKLVYDNKDEKFAPFPRSIYKVRDGEFIVTSGHAKLIKSRIRYGQMTIR